MSQNFQVFNLTFKLIDLDLIETKSELEDAYIFGIYNDSVFDLDSYLFNIDG